VKNIYLKIITFLYNNYCGIRTVKLFGKKYTAVKASKILFPFFLLWGITKLFQAELHISPLDILFFILLAIQYIASFTMIVANEYKRLTKFNCYEIWRPNIPDNGCTTQCKECAERDKKENIK
jgi:hypothetical protein